MLRNCTPFAHGQVRDGRGRILARVPFASAEAGDSYRQILLPRWFRARLAHGGKLWTRLSFGVHEGDGTSEQTRLAFLLSGRAQVQVTTGPLPRG
jgi:hypothetical protein